MGSMEFSDREFPPPLSYIRALLSSPRCAHSQINSAYPHFASNKQSFLQNLQKLQFFSFLSCLLFLRMGGWTIETGRKHTLSSHSTLQSNSEHCQKPQKKF